MIRYTKTFRLYEFSELNEEAREKAIADHIMFEIEVADEDSYIWDSIEKADKLQTPWFASEIIYEDHKDDIIETIEINEYLFFKNGKFTMSKGTKKRQPPKNKTVRLDSVCLKFSIWTVFKPPVPFTRYKIKTWGRFPYPSPNGDTTSAFRDIRKFYCMVVCGEDRGLPSPPVYSRYDLAILTPPYQRPLT